MHPVLRGARPGPVSCPRNGVGGRAPGGRSLFSADEDPAPLQARVVAAQASHDAGRLPSPSPTAHCRRAVPRSSGRGGRSPSLTALYCHSHGHCHVGRAGQLAAGAPTNASSPTSPGPCQGQKE